MHSNDFFLYITSFLSNARKKQELRRQYIVKLMVQKSVCTPLWRMAMRWNDLWMLYFGTTESFGIDLGFWIGLFLIMTIVILMNLVCWSMLPKRKQ